MCLLVDTELNINQQFSPASKKGNGILGCISQSISSRSRDVILPLCSVLWPQSECCVQKWSSQYKKDIDILERVQIKAIKMIKGLDYLSYEESLRKLGQFNPQKKWLMGNLINVYQYLMGRTKTELSSGYPKRLLSLTPWRYSKPIWTWSPANGSRCP